MPRVFLLVVSLFPLALSSAGCGHNVGDACSTNVDCDPTGLRFCDTSAPAGYCTIDGCDVATCPDNSVCVRFLTQVEDEPCIYGRACGATDGGTDDGGTDDGGIPPGCRVDERCVCDVTVSGVCSDINNAHCAPESTERRWCQKTCGNDTDCRTGYPCRETGTLGGEPVPTADMLSGVPAKFCAPLGS